MNVYVPASSAPPNPGWKQKLSIVVVFGSGLAIAALATSSFDKPSEVAPTTKVVLPPAPLPGPSLGSIAPAQVSGPSIAAPTPATAKTKMQARPLPLTAPVHRTQLFFTQSATGVEPTALPPEPSYRPPPSSFMPPIASPQTPVGKGLSTRAPQDLPSNMAVVGDGVYQVTPAAPASGVVPSETGGAPETSASGSIEQRQIAPESVEPADDQGTLPDQGETCVPDESVPAQDPAPAVAPSTQGAPTTNSTQSESDAQQDGLSAAATPLEQAEPLEAATPEIAQAAEPSVLPNDVSPLADNSAVSGGTVPPAGNAAAPHDHADNASSSAAPDGAPHPCKVSVQVEGSPTVEIPIFLVDGHEPAVRLSSLLDLVRSRLSNDDYQRLRGSRSAEAIVSVRELASAGFTFQVVDGTLAISVTG